MCHIIAAPGWFERMKVVYNRFDSSQVSAAMAHALLFVCLVASFALPVRGNLTDRYMNCGQMVDYCSAHGTSLRDSGPEVTPSHALARVGKAGPKGEKGDVGPRGPIAEFNYASFQNGIFTKVKEMITKCRVFFKDSCFYVIGDSGSKYTKEVLQRKCEDGGGRLANIYSEEHRIAVGRYIRDKIGVYAQITTGMSYNVQARQFHLTTGNTGDIRFTWHPGYPLGDSNKNHVFFSVHPDPASAGQGIFNYFSSHGERYGLCEFELQAQFPI